jgi:hypothetical protein
MPVAGRASSRDRRAWFALESSKPSGMLFLPQHSCIPDARRFRCRAEKLSLLSEYDLAEISAITKFGFRIPKGLSIAGFDSIDLGQCTQPPLTTVGLRAGLGRMAFGTGVKQDVGEECHGLLSDSPHSVSPRIRTGASLSLLVHLIEHE